MIELDWRRIAGIHYREEGGSAAVWLAHDKDADTVHLYHCALYHREPPALVADAFNALGRWIPIAWEQSQKDLVDKLLDRGCNVLPEPSKQTPVLAEAVSLEIIERMKSGRFKVDTRMAEWLDEYKSFYKVDAKVPIASHPLMCATRYAMAELEYARRAQPKGKAKTNYPRIAMI